MQLDQKTIFVQVYSDTQSIFSIHKYVQCVISTILFIYSSSRVKRFRFKKNKRFKVNRKFWRQIRTMIDYSSLIGCKVQIHRTDDEIIEGVVDMFNRTRNMLSISKAYSLKKAKYLADEMNILRDNIEKSKLTRLVHSFNLIYMFWMLLFSHLI